MGTTIHGSKGTLYLAPGSGAAVPVSEAVDYSIDLDSDIQETTPLGSKWRTRVKGPIGWKGTFNANFDKSSTTLWDAGTSQDSQSLYLYPDKDDPTSYYYGMAFITLGKAAAGSATSKASSSITADGDGELGVNG